MPIVGDSKPSCRGGLARTRLVCPWCGASRPPDLGPSCVSCGGTLEAATAGNLLLPERIASLWDFEDVLPVGARRVTLGEGGTPLLKLDALFPGDNVFVKADSMNPTGSFKDRGAAVAMSAAVELGAKGVVCASTGNNGASVSAYAARAGLPCIVALPAGTPMAKVAQARSCGATVVEVPGTFSDAYELAERIQQTVPGWANFTSTFINPFMTAAHATIAYELAVELRGEIGSILVPIGAGPMLAGIMAGAERLLAAGRIARLPVPIGVQATECSPIARAFAEGSSEVTAWAEACTSMAGSINDPLRGYAADGTRTLDVVRRAGGIVHAVDDEAIERAMADLGCIEGISAEPAAATPLAALRALDAIRPLPRPVVLVVSGHALKDPNSQARLSPKPIAFGEAMQPAGLVELAVNRHAALQGSAS